MRLCRIRPVGTEPALCFYYDDWAVPVSNMHLLNHMAAYGSLPLLPDPSREVLSYLPPHWANYQILQQLELLADTSESEEELRISLDDVWLDLPVPMPHKVLCLAGNYAEHVQESGGTPIGKEQTFPFFFMKPPTTTVRPAGYAIALPANSPDHIDWEVELTVVIGAYAKDVDAEDASDIIAGYTVGLDISNRRLRLNPNRVEQERTAFHEWLCGKWHDGFAPVGPCIVPNDGTFDPTQADISLSVNGEVMQQSNTANMVFDVYEIVSYASKIMTLEPGDLIMTGTPSGVGSARGVFLKSGDQLAARIDGIGTLEATIS
ncbi:MAG: fumarylacetoacetate hydrolase family protein [Anaerolineae bacterium]|nr:fumarylacetoacetate hydrolase family protein [Anaerolineae bacterium]